MFNPPDDVPSTNMRFRSDLFSIRLWREVDGDGERWRGRMDHVATGRVRYFHDWDSFVQGLSELAAPA